MAAPRGESWPIQTVVEGIPDAVALIDADGRIIAWNPAMATMWEIPPAVALAREFNALDVGYRVPQLRAAVEEVKRTLQVVTLPSVNLERRDGTLVPATATVTATRSGGRVGVLVYLSSRPEAIRGRLEDAQFDVAELELENERLLVANEELLTLNEELLVTRDNLEVELDRMRVTRADARLVGRVVMGLLALTRMRAVDDGAVERAFALLETTPSLAPRVLDELADLEALASQKLRLERSAFGLDELANDAIDGANEAATMTGVRLDVTGTGDVTVRGDRRRLAQVASTLIGNAVRFSESGGRVAVDIGREGDLGRLRVTDTGCGLSADALPFVFEPFRRAPGLRPIAHHGLGLRLAIARGMVELHGGRIRADSAGEGLGTAMTVYLPAA